MTYGQPTVVGGTAPVNLSCTPVSGSTFPVGASTVTCTATDAKQRLSSCTVAITVTAPPRISVTSFAAFGDSITRGEDGNNVVTSFEQGRLTFRNDIILVGFEYPSVLATALRSRYSAQSCVIGVANLGQPGESLRNAPARFSSVVLNRGYQGVFIMQGAIDTYDAYYSGVGVLDAAITNLTTMVRQAKSNGLRVYLATLPPQLRQSACVPACRGYGQDFVPTFNEKVRTLAAAEAVTLVDVFRAFNGDLSLLSTDGLHPNANGFQRIADTFFEAVKSTAETTAPGANSCSTAPAFSPFGR